MMHECVCLVAVSPPQNENYAERLQLSQFYVANDQKDEALEILKEMQSEYENLLKPNRKLYQQTFSDVDKLATSLE